MTDDTTRWITLDEHQTTVEALQQLVAWNADRLKKAEQEAAALQRENERLAGAKEVARLTGEAANCLREAIEEAPHTPECAEVPFGCTCWKSRVLVQKPAEPSAPPSVTACPSPLDHDEWGNPALSEIAQAEALVYCLREGHREDAAGHIVELEKGLAKEAAHFRQVRATHKPPFPEKAKNAQRQAVRRIVAEHKLPALPPGYLAKVMSVGWLSSQPPSTWTEVEAHWASFVLEAREAWLTAARYALRMLDMPMPIPAEPPKDPLARARAALDKAVMKGERTLALDAVRTAIAAARKAGLWWMPERTLKDGEGGCRQLTALARHLLTAESALTESGTWAIGSND